jgi:hypothetical protein
MDALHVPSSDFSTAPERRSEGLSEDISVSWSFSQQHALFLSVTLGRL